MNEYGAIPAGLLFSETQYESTYNVFPSQQMNALGQTTLYANNDLLHAVILGGSVVSETDPSGHGTSSQFDLFRARVQGVDNLDSQGSPTKSFSYGWTTLPNSTTVNERDRSAVDAAERLLHGRFRPRGRAPRAVQR